MQSNKKHIAILGSTGSIGTQALEVIENFKESFEVEVLTAGSNSELLIKQALQFNPNAVVIADEDKYESVRDALKNTDIKVFAGEKSIEDVVSFDEIDLVLVALVGFAGLRPTVAAIKAGKTIALANKETMVVAGETITNMAAANHVAILPVDSEHSAIFQCMQGEFCNKIHKILLTASGGAFRGMSLEQLKKVKVEDALTNPNWTMGKKVTIDSATLMNKGLEMIEAKWFFNVEPRNIVPVVHPQSIIHSMVEFEDGNIKALMSKADMRLPILYSLSYPMRFSCNERSIDLFEIAKLTFERPDYDTFPCLSLAFSAIEKGGNMPCILNAANEVALDKFLQREIDFLSIPKIVENAMGKVSFISRPTIEDCFATDEQVKRMLE